MQIQIGVDQGPANLPTSDYLANPKDWLGADQEWETATAEYERQMYGIGAGMEAIKDLVHVQSILRNSKENDKSSLKMAKLIMQQHQQRLQMPLLSIGKESLDDRSVALEGIGSFLKSIVMAIINTLKAIWEAVARFFTGTRKDKSEKQTDNSLREIRKNSDIKIPAQPIQHGIFANFYYLGEDIKIDAINVDLDKFKKSTSTAAEILKKFVAYREQLGKNIDELAAAGQNGEITTMDFDLFLKNCFDSKADSYSGFENTLKSEIPRLLNRKMYKESIMEIVDKYDLTGHLGVTDFLALDGYINGASFSVVLAPIVTLSKIDKDVSDISFEILHQNTRTKKPVSVDFNDSHALNQMVLEITSIGNVMDTFDKFAAKAVGKSDILNNLQSLAEQSSSSDPASQNEAIWLVSQTVKWIGQLFHLVTITDRSLLYYRDVFNYVVQVYKTGKK